MHRAVREPRWTPTPEEAPSSNNSSPFSWHRHRKLLIIAGVVLCAVVAAVIAFQHFWPFTQRSLTSRLHQHSSAIVEFGGFHELFFPRPGFMAEHVVIRRTPSAPPSVSVAKLTVLAAYSGLIGSPKSISLLKAEGLVVNVSTGDGTKNLEFHRTQKDSTPLRLEHLVADGSTLQVSGSNSSETTFRISRLRMDDLGDPAAAASFELALQYPKPTMQLSATGKLGPWRTDKVLMTPVSGSFSAISGNLAGIRGLHGQLSGNGQFKGRVGEVEVAGHADVADFEVRSPDHPMPLHVQFDSAVNTEAARVALRSVEAQLARTNIHGSGVILAGNQRSPDAADFALRCDHGRVDDLLSLFTSSPRPSMAGPIRFQTTAAVQRGTRPFLERVRLNGSFDITGAEFTSPVTQYKLDKLSARSKGNPEDETPPERAAALSGHVELSDGVAHLSDIRFQVPGAYATGGGTFNVLDKRVHLQGRLLMQAELSEATKGVKSFFLKLLDPIYKKHGAGAEVPVNVTGTSQHAKFKVDLK